VKIRGTAAHIAEKYMSLARDALASGDMVTAESYLQHAEHYNRIIMAAQQQFGAQHGGQHQGEGPNGGYRPQRFNAEGGDDDGDETGDGGGDIRAGGEFNQGSQDQRRHAGDREHHHGGGGGRDRGQRHGGHGGNGRDGGRDQNGADQPDPAASTDETSDQVS
jgi:hypothetical protein